MLATTPAPRFMYGVHCERCEHWELFGIQTMVTSSRSLILTVIYVDFFPRTYRLF